MTQLWSEANVGFSVLAVSREPSASPAPVVAIPTQAEPADLGMVPTATQADSAQDLSAVESPPSPALMPSLPPPQPWQPIAGEVVTDSPVATSSNPMDGTETFNPINGTEVKDFLLGSDSSDVIQAFDDNDFFMAQAGDDLVFAGTGNDAGLGGEGNDTLLGEAGDDSLDGGVGDDVLDGGEGNDTLVGGAGVDTLIGGLGQDTFQLGDYAGDELLASSPDVISDFSIVDQDVLNLSILASRAVFNNIIIDAAELLQYVSFAPVPTESADPSDSDAPVDSVAPVDGAAPVDNSSSEDSAAPMNSIVVAESAYLVVALPDQLPQTVALIAGVSATALTDAMDTYGIVGVEAPTGLPVA
jgi:hypothetical protein